MKLCCYRKTALLSLSLALMDAFVANLMLNKVSKERTRAVVLAVGIITKCYDIVSHSKDNTLVR